MPTFTVSLCRETLEFVDIEIEADSEEEAETIALKIARESKNELYWEADEDSAKEPQVSEIRLSHND